MWKLWNWPFFSLVSFLFYFQPFSLSLFSLSLPFRHFYPSLPPYISLFSFSISLSVFSFLFYLYNITGSQTNRHPDTDDTLTCLSVCQTASCPYTHEPINSPESFLFLSGLKQFFSFFFHCDFAFLLAAFANIRTCYAFRCTFRKINFSVSGSTRQDRQVLLGW